MIAAGAARQFRITGDSDAVRALGAFRSAALHLSRETLDQRPILTNWRALLDYLRIDMATSGIERCRVLYLNARNILLGDEVLSEGTIDETAIYVREVVRRALEAGAASLILVHNHPSGDPSPSRADIDITRAIAEVGARLNIAVLDHLIVSAGGHVSLRSLGLI